MANVNLKNAKTSKNDEFYTQYSDIQSEVNIEPATHGETSVSHGNRNC